MVSGILLILSIIDFTLTAPVLVQENLQAGVDAVHTISKDAITVLGKRMDEDVVKLAEELFKTGGKMEESAGAGTVTHGSPSSAPLGANPPTKLASPKDSGQADGSQVEEEQKPVPSNPGPSGVGPSNPGLTTNPDSDRGLLGTTRVFRPPPPGPHRGVMGAYPGSSPPPPGPYRGSKGADPGSLQTQTGPYRGSKGADPGSLRTPTDPYRGSKGADPGSLRTPTGLYRGSKGAYPGSLPPPTDPYRGLMGAYPGLLRRPTDPYRGSMGADPGSLPPPTGPYRGTMGASLGSPPVPPPTDPDRGLLGAYQPSSDLNTYPSLRVKVHPPSTGTGLSTTPEHELVSQPPSPNKESEYELGHGPPPKPSYLNAYPSPRVAVHPSSTGTGLSTTPEHELVTQPPSPNKEPNKEPEYEVGHWPPLRPASTDPKLQSSAGIRPEDLQAAIYEAKYNARKSPYNFGTVRDAWNAGPREFKPAEW